MAVLKKINLAGWILIAMVLGIVCGLLFLNNPEFTTNYIKPFGTIFINLLKFVAVPLVLLSLICSMISMGDIKKVGSIGWKTVAFFLATTLIAICISLVIGLGTKGFYPVLETSDAEYAASSATVMDIIVNIFPSNLWTSLMNSDMLQIIVIAILIGAAILVVGKAAEPFAKVIQSASVVFSKITSFIIYASPIGVFCLICNVIAVNGTQIIGSLAIVLGFTYLAITIQLFVVYSISLKALAKTSPLAFFKALFPAIVFAFSSQSSLATLPLTAECANKAGANPEYSSFVLPLGATIHMDGSAIYYCFSTVFIASCYGVDLSGYALFMIVVTVTLATIGCAGVPGGGIALLAMILESVGLPVEGITLILGVGTLFGMGITTVNVVGDAVAALVITRFQDGKLTDKA